MTTPVANNSPYQYFNFDLNDPGLIVILNRGTRFEKDITNDVRTAQTSNSVESIAGSFTMQVDNTNDIYVDRFGFSSIKVMSSIEIFAKSLSLNFSDSQLQNNFDSTQIPASCMNLNQFIDTYYNNPDDLTKSTYVSQIIALNQTRQSATSTGAGFTDPITKKDFILTTSAADQARMNVLRQSPLRVPPLSNLYQRIFLGIVLNVSQNVSPGGELTISLSGKSIGYWLEATPLNIRPGEYEVTLNNIDLTAYSNHYSTSNAMDIFRELIRFSTDDILLVTDFSTDTYGTAQSVIALNGVVNNNILDTYGNPQKQSDANGNPTDQNTTFTTSRPTSQMNELSNMQQNLYNGIPLNSSATTTSDAITGDSAWTQFSQTYVTDKADLDNAQTQLDSQVQALQSQITTISTSAVQNQQQQIAALQQQINATSDATTKASLQQQITYLTTQNPSAQAVQLLANQLQQTISEGQNRISILKAAVAQDQANIEGNPTFQTQQIAITQQMNSLKQQLASSMKAGRSNILNQIGIIEHWKNIFAQMQLEVVDNNNFLELVYPLKIALTEPDPSLDGDYISKADLANMIAQNLMYEFYVDTNGHFILKPPLYNIGIQINDPTYIIEEGDIFNLSLNESVDGIITRIGVTGDYNYPVTLIKEQIYNIHQDLNLIRDYGFHSQEIANRMFLHSNSDCRDFGKSYMTKNNMELNSASVTINGRPEIRLGTTVYLKPRDTMYYIKEINHEITTGGQFQTTLTLVGARRIITGFKARSNLTTISQISNAAPTPENPGLGVDQGATFHYILASAVNQEAITDAMINSGPTIFDREQPNTNAQQLALQLNPVTALLLNQSISPNDTVNRKAIQTGAVPQILRNVYQITSSINPAYVGLIVDSTDKSLSEINTANYNFFKTLSVDSIGTSLTFLQIPIAQQYPAIAFIKDSFNTFLFKHELSNPADFTIALRDQFILYFLKTTSSLVSSSTTNNGNGNTSVNAQATVASTAATILNQLINQIDNAGAYRQYTDSDGRELPSYFDYGKSLLIDNNQISVESFNNIQQATNAQQQTQSTNTKALQALGYKPQSGAVPDLNSKILNFISNLQNATSPAPNTQPQPVATTLANAQNPTALAAQPNAGPLPPTTKPVPTQTVQPTPQTSPAPGGA